MKTFIYAVPLLLSMIQKETLGEIVELQRKELKLVETGIEREALKLLKPMQNFALILSGVRRCGKSTLMRQIISRTKGFYYFNFEDPRAVNFEVNDFQKLDQIFKEKYGEQEVYFFDEIQNVQNWELFIRKLVDNKKQVVITGSNASLLSKELGTRLTGRHLTYEVFPFSYTEYLKIMKAKPQIESFRRYLFEGGFPQYLCENSPFVLQELLKDILMRDIATRHKIRNIKTLNELAIFLLTNVGKEFSYNSLKTTFKLGSINSIISFISFFEDSYLLFSVPKFDYSYKKQIVNPKKIYSIDNGLSNKNSASFSEDEGRMLENLVFISLRKKSKDIFYFKEESECDFLVKDRGKITQAIQVCYKLTDENKDREISGLIAPLKKFELNSGLILTYNQEDDFLVEGKKIITKPIWKWLLEK